MAQAAEDFQKAKDQAQSEYQQDRSEAQSALDSCLRNARTTGQQEECRSTYDSAIEAASSRLQSRQDAAAMAHQNAQSMCQDVYG